MMRFSAALLALAVALGSAPAHAKKKRVVVDRIVAVVDKTPITQSALDRETRPFRKGLVQKYALDVDARREALREIERTTLHGMIDTRLLLQAAEEARISASKEEIDRAVAEVAKQGGRSVPELLQMVAQEGYDEPEYRRRLGEQLVTWQLATREAVKRTPDFSRLGSEDQRAKVTAMLKTLASELRNAAHIEERL
jgi:peptidyl-prolyl cis-trans isomerase SurA